MSTAAASNKGFFLTKKQKRLLKERRRKMKTFRNNEGKQIISAVSISEGAPVDDLQAQQSGPRVDEEPPNEADEPTPETTTPNEDTKTKTGKRKRSSSSNNNNTTIIYIPDEIFDNPKAAKKFRKEARRDAKRQNVGDHEKDHEPVLRFMKESERKTRKFPVLKELVKQQQEEKRQQDQAAVTAATNQKKEEPSDAEIAKYIALDCEMVGIGTEGKKSVLARASLVDWHGNCLYDRYVRVPGHVTDFRTKYSGIRPNHVKGRKAVDPSQCRNDIAKLIKGKILVGHALHNDLQVLMLNHQDVRDTAKYRPFQRLSSYGDKYQARKLKDLVAEHLQLTIQTGSHDSVQDAAAAMALYRTVHVEWERELALQQEKKIKQLQRQKKKSNG